MELTKQKTYKKVFDMACADLLRLDLQEQSRKGDIRYEEKGRSISLEIPFFDENILLTIPEFSFTSSRKGATVNLVTKIIILHYIVHASGIPLHTEQISYEDIGPGARHYLPVFEKRVAKPLVTAFGFNRDAFLEAGIALGAQEEVYGSASFTLNALPRIPVTFILWEGDEEFPPSIKILFNPTIAGYLPLEDIVVTSKLAATRIIRAARLKYAEEVIE
ncbi:MAG: hypothetical protein C0392_09945 [Syntrophus sp. (in: bacteria)]|nr:hypothetical protein [Syntrophus sp. (in: bacteria)]